jgi:hypothetical protein
MKTNLLVIGLLLAACLSCRMIDTMSGSGKAGTVDALWDDVPPVTGATKSDMALPLGARLAIRAAWNGKVNFISFKTAQSPQEVEGFYSKDRMKAAGWTPNDRGCITDTDNKENQGAVCLFDRKDGDKREGLAIVLAQDEKSKETDIFYARVDLTPEKAK